MSPCPSASGLINGGVYGYLDLSLAGLRRRHDAGEPVDRPDRLLCRDDRRPAAGAGAYQRRGDPAAAGFRPAFTRGVGADPAGDGLYRLRIRRANLIDSVERARRCRRHYDRPRRLSDGPAGSRRRCAVDFRRQFLLWLTDRHRRYYFVRAAARPVVAGVRSRGILRADGLRHRLSWQHDGAEPAEVVPRGVNRPGAGDGGRRR